MNQSGYDYDYKIPEGNFTPVKAGLRGAILQAIAHLGYQGGGQFRPSAKIAFVFQTDDEDKVIWQKHTVSKRANSNMFKFFAEWMPGTDIATLNLPDLLGKAAVLNIKHVPNPATGKISARFGTPMADEDGKSKNIVASDYALILPGMPKDFVAKELVKLPNPLQKDYATQLSEVQYQAQMDEWRAREEAEKAATAAQATNINV